MLLPILQKGRPTAPTASSTILVPTKYHAKIAQGGRFFRSLPSGTRVTHEGQKPPSSSVKAKKPPTSSGSATPTARIDDETEQQVEGAESVEFQLVALYDDEESAEGAEGKEIPWVVQSTSEEDAQRVVKEIEKQLEQAREATHVAWITVPRGLSERRILAASETRADEWILQQCPESSAEEDRDLTSFARTAWRSKSSARGTRTVRLILLGTFWSPC